MMLKTALGTGRPLSAPNADENYDELLAFLAPGQFQEEHDSASADANEERVWVIVDGEAIGGVVRESRANDVKLIELQNGTTAEFSKDKYYKQNPARLDKTADMTNLTFLDEPNVFHNLKSRYQTETLMYTKSGMFTIAINPYKHLNIYGPKFVRAFDATPTSEHQPHIYPVAIDAYKNMMLNGGQSQSILCTGESGAGKTVNCKHALRCLTLMSEKSSKNAASMENDMNGNDKTSSMSKMSIEDQIMSANPILESFGNAKTVKNDNSSRFGRFTQINYNQNGTIMSSNIKTFLLETSRVTGQAPGERNFHIFYLACEGLPQDMRNKCFIEGISTYKMITNGPMNVPDVQSKKWTEELLQSFQMFNIDPMDVFKVVSAVMLLPNLQFKMGGQVPIIENDGLMNKISSLLGIDQTQLTRAICEPTMTVSGQTTRRQQTPEQCHTSCLTIARVIYEQLFNYMVKAINKCTSMIENQIQYTISLVDIAGFEIFENNSLEQLQINLTNEKLQQFFNHHTFKLEKETYESEGIDVKVEDYGLDLQPTIDMIYNDPNVSNVKTKNIFGTVNNLTRLGATKTDQDLLFAIESDIKGTSEKFSTPKIRSDTVHFSINHYAGVVDYNTQGWLIKNRHPIHDDIMTALKTSNFSLMKEMFPNLSNVKAGLLQTSLNAFVSELMKVMQKLEVTVPHFVRCIIPNLNKVPGQMDYKLVVNQLRCNGIIEGIRIVRKGYPNRMTFSVFKANYMCILESSKDLRHANARDVSVQIIEKANIQELSKVGKSKVFLKAEVIGMLEDIKSRIITHNIVVIQALAYKRYLMMKQNDFSASLNSIRTIREGIQAWYKMKDNPWFKLVAMVYPTQTKLSHEIELKKKKEALAEADRKLKENKETISQYQEEIKKLREQIELLKEQNEQLDASYNALQEANMALEQSLREQTELIEERDARIEELESAIEALEAQKAKYKEEMETVTGMYDDVMNEKKGSDMNNKKMHDQMSELNTQIETLQEENSSLKAKTQSLETQYNDAQTDLEKTRASLSQAEKSGDGLQNDYDDLIQEADGTKRELAKLQKELASLKRDLDQEKTENQNLTDQLDKFQAANERGTKKSLEHEEQISQLNNEKLDLTNKLTAEIAEKDNLAEDLAREQKNLKKAQSDIEHLKSEKDELVASLDDGEEGMVAMKQVEAQLRQHLQNSETQKQELQDEFERTKKKLGDELSASREQASNANISATNEIKNCKDNIRRLEEEIEDLQSDLEKSKGQATESSTQAKRYESRIQELNARVDDLENECSGLKSNLDKKSSKLNEITESLDSANSELQQMKNKAGSLSADNTSLEDQINSLNDANRKLNRKCQDLQESYDQATANVAELEESLAATQANYNSIQNKCQTEADRGQALESDLEDMESKCRKLTAERDSLDSDLAILTTKSNNLAKEKKNLENELDDASAQCDQLKRELDNVKRNAKGSENTIKGLQSAQDELAGKLRNVEGEVLRKESKINGLSSDKQELESEITTLNSKLKNLEMSLEEATANTDSAQKLSKVMKQLHQKDEELNELQTAICEAEDRMAQLEGENKSIQQRILNAANQHERDLENASEEYMSKMSTMHQKINDLESEKMRLLRLAKEASKKSKDAAERADSAEMDLESLKSKLEQLQSNEKSLSSQLKDKQSELAHLQSELDNLNKASIDSNTKLSQAKRIAEENEQKYQRANSELSNLRAEIDTTTSHADDMSSRFNKAKSRNKELDSQLQSMHEELEQAQNQVQSLQQSSDRYRAEAQKYQALANDAMSDLESHEHSTQSRINSLQLQLQDAEAETSRLRSQAANDKRKLTNLESEYEAEQSQLKAEANKLNTKLRSLTKEAEDLRKAAESLESENRTLSEKNTKAASDNRKLKMLSKDLQNQVDNYMAKQKHMLDNFDSS